MNQRLLKRGVVTLVAAGAMMWPKSEVGAESQPTPAPEEARGTPEDFRFTKPQVRPPPVNVDYFQSGVALHFLFALDAGPACPADAEVPCILGSGGGLAARAGYRSRGPWYVGGAYSLAKIDTSGLMRLGVLQQVTGETRYLFNFGLRTEPYLTSGMGAVAFGNEWALEAWGVTTFGGAGYEVQISRTTVVGMAATYRPILMFEWIDRAGQQRGTGIAHFWGLAITMEARDALGSHTARGR